MNMIGYIGFEQVRVLCEICVYVEEYDRKQEIFIDLRAEVDLTLCTQTDALEDAVDYIQLYKLCQSVAKRKHYRLVESLTHALTEEIIKLPAILAIKIRVKKPSALF